uniref:Podocalyxin like 2 n=1 Tax=Sphenodon punctatus TaxID=8508 RepID=A0A8D0GAC7_SPHPU
MEPIWPISQRFFISGINGLSVCFYLISCPLLPLAAGGGSLYVCLVSPEESTTEGLTSTSLSEFSIMSHLESLDSSEQNNLEATELDFVPSALQAAPGSGFASEENEESKILQPPQYFWEDGGDLNDSSLDLGQATDYNFPVASQKALPKGNGTQAKDNWETDTIQQSSDPIEPNPYAPSPSALEEEEGLLPINQTKGRPQKDSLFSRLFPTATNRVGAATKAPVDGQEEDSAPEHPSSGSDLGSSMGPSLLPVSSILSATPAGSQGVSEYTFKVTTGNGVTMGGAGVELAEATVPVEFTEVTAGAGAGHPLRAGLTFPRIQTLARSVYGEIPSHPSLKLPLPAAGRETAFCFQSISVSVWVLFFQVICKDWSNLAGKNYIILNMSDNIDCEEFRLERGPQLLALVEDAFSRQVDGPQDQWLISLSKPNENDKHLLMTLAGEQGVVPMKDVLMALGDVKRSLAEIGIQNYTTTTNCQSHPSQTRSDYGKLFVVLVIIGSICVLIIIMALIYNCWQRRLPKMKNMSHGEELRFVENGCHDNPTLDVASDSQSEMQEKKPSVNGGGALNGPDGWDVLIDKRANEETDVFEEDTHL